MLKDQMKFLFEYLGLDMAQVQHPTQVEQKPKQSIKSKRMSAQPIEASRSRLDTYDGSRFDKKPIVSPSFQINLDHDSDYDPIEQSNSGSSNVDHGLKMLQSVNKHTHNNEIQSEDNSFLITRNDILTDLVNNNCNVEVDLINRGSDHFSVHHVEDDTNVVDKTAALISKFNSKSPTNIKFSRNKENVREFESVNVYHHDKVNHSLNNTPSQEMFSTHRKVGEVNITTRFNNKVKERSKSRKRWFG